jgi:rhodanese-related sulfurtransferase
VTGPRRRDPFPPPRAIEAARSEDANNEKLHLRVARRPSGRPEENMTTFKEMIRRVKSEIREVSPEEARARAGEATLIDVREADEWAQGHVPGAVFIPRGFLELRVEEKVPDRAQEVILYCAGGTRSALAARALKDLGYENVSSMAGGFGKWKEAGFRIEVPKSLSAEQKQRYSRHLLVPEVGEAGQAKLLAAKALLVGAGQTLLGRLLTYDALALSFREF